MDCAEAGRWESTSLQAVRERAGVSNGSLFHHFRTRQHLTTAVVGAALHDHQQVLLAELVDDARAGVTRTVRRHLRWVEDNQSVARLLLSAPPGLPRQVASTPALAANRQFFTDLAKWLHQHGWAQQPPLPVVLALWIGPAQEYSRHWLALDDRPRLDAAADDLAEGAWAALDPLLRDASVAQMVGR